jgi:hypothetical protein
MFRAIAKLLSLSTVVVIGLIVILLYRNHTDTDRKVAELQYEKQQLLDVVNRLTDERRVAEMLVTDQKIVGGVPQTTLLFQEYSRNKSMLPPKQFTISGDQVHVDAMVIKFEHGLVEKDDALRGHSIALFTRMYGNHQSPDQGPTIDTPGQIPGFYEGIDPSVSSFETNLWQNFWKLARDSDYRQKMGVRVSNGQSVWWPCEPGMLYTISIESAGGLNMSMEPLKGIFREALKLKTGG